MRHAKSSWKSGAPSDHERPLNKRGRRAAPLVAERLAELGYEPELVLCSDAVRTLQTWEAMRDAFEGEPELRACKSLYLGDIDGIREELAQVPSRVRSVLVLGHNPGWEEAAEWLCSEPVILKTADVLVAQGTGKRWANAVKKQGSWSKLGLIRARDLAS